jgi:hypothetical protein
VTDEDSYDTTDMTNEAVEAARVVKFAAAVEADGVVHIKVATMQGGEPMPLSALKLVGFKEYMFQVKDAGVALEVINAEADHFRIQVDVYYNPMVLDNAGMSLATGVYPVQDAIKAFVRDLPFNGEYRNVSLVDALQQIEGVTMPELHLAESSRNGSTWIGINAREVPYSGYYKIYQPEDLNLNFIPN